MEGGREKGEREGGREEGGREEGRILECGSCGSADAFHFVAVLLLGEIEINAVRKGIRLVIFS